MTEHNGPDFTVGDPIEPPTAPAAVDEPGWDPPAPRPGRKRRRLLVIGAPITVAVLAGGAFAAAQLVGALSGTGTPGLASALPSSTIAFAQVNLDPDADQKIAMYDIGKKFPKVKHAVTKNDPAHSLIDYFIKRSGNADDAVTWNDIKSWAGVRVGLALLATSDAKPYPLLAVQIKNADKAAAGIAKLKSNEADTDDFFYKIDGKYAYASDSQAHLDAAIQDLDTNGALAGTAAFKPAAKTVGDGDILGGYANLAALKPLARSYVDQLADKHSELNSVDVGGGFASSDGSECASSSADSFDDADSSDGSECAYSSDVSAPTFDPAQLDKTLDALKGVMSLHVQLNGGGGQLKVDGFGIGSSTVAAGTASGVFSLPSDSTIGLGATGLSTVLKAELGNDALDSVLSGSGLTADDLRGLLGNDAAFSLGANLGSDSPDWGVIVHGGDAAKAKASLNKIVDQAGGDFSGAIGGSGDTYTIASSSAYAAKLGSGRLGDDPLFKKAVPDAQGSQVIAFIDIGSLVVADDGASAVAQQFSAVGVTARSTGDSMHVELTVVLK